MVQPELHHQFRKKPRGFSGLLLIAIACILLTYTAMDAFKIRPELNRQIDTVTTNFQNLKVFLDIKLPEIDSLLIIHTDQIVEQNTQLRELNKLTEILKEN